MGKVLVKMTTRLQKFLAAIARDCDAPTPVTNQEKLLWNIAEEMKSASQGGGAGLPTITDADDGKVLTANSGEWVAASPSSGGALVVTDTDGTLDKTWREIHDADFAVIKVGESTLPVYEVRKDGTTTYIVNSMKYQSGTFSLRSYTASSASNYPTVVSTGGGGND